MATMAVPIRSDGVPVNVGFTDEDRRRFERIDIRVEDILQRMNELVSRIGTVEGSLPTMATRDELHELEIDIDDLRGRKADRVDLSARVVSEHEARLRVLEGQYTAGQEEHQRLDREVQQVRKDLEPLKAWHWKEIGALAGVMACIEILLHVFWK